MSNSLEMYIESIRKKMIADSILKKNIQIELMKKRLVYFQNRLMKDIRSFESDTKHRIDTYFAPHYGKTHKSYHPI